MADFDPIAAGFIPAGPSPGNTAPAAAPGSSPPIAAATPPGFDEITKANAAQHVAMSQRAGTYANDMFPLFKAKEQLALTKSGKFSEPGYNAGAFLNTYAPEALHRALSYASTLGGMVGGILNPEETKAYAEANKYLTMSSLGVPGAARSDAGNQTAAAATPSVHIPQGAAQAVLTGMIGQRRMEHDHALQWMQSGLPLQAMNGFMGQLQTRANPLVYTWDQFKPEQQDKMLGKMGSADRADFMKQVRDAKSRGIYNSFGMGGQ